VLAAGAWRSWALGSGACQSRAMALGIADGGAVGRASGLGAPWHGEGGGENVGTGGMGGGRG
jgi:hypothetical protein